MENLQQKIEALAKDKEKTIKNKQNKFFLVFGLIMVIIVIFTLNLL